MEKNFLLAVVLAGLVLMVSQYYLTPPAPPPTEKAAETAKESGPAAKAPAAAPAAVSAQKTASPAQAAGEVRSEQEETVTVETDLHKVVFSNRGAVVRSWILKQFKDSKGQPLELVNPRALALAENQALPAPFALAFKSAPSNDPNDDLYRVERSGEENPVVSFEFSDGRITARKSFTFAKDSYLVMLHSQVIENGVLVPHSLAWRGGFGDSTVVNPVPDTNAVYYDVPGASLNKKQVGEAKEGPVSASGQFAFAGQEDKYFAQVVLPVQAGGSVELTTYSDNVPKEDGSEDRRLGAAVGGSGVNSFELFVGPKDQDILRAVDPRLDQLLDWGWFWFLAKPLFYSLTWVSNAMTHNYGWAIVIVTVVINIILFPLRLSSMKSSKKMQAIQPLVNAINAKYKDIPLKDPRKQEQNRELMELYQKHGINPVGGCVPILLQVPFFFALYKVLTLAIEMRGAEWLWVSDLSQPETLAIRVLPVLMVITQFISQKMTPSPGMDPAQQKMMLLMPLVFGYMFYFASAGLVLYWLTSNVVSIVQQWLLNRKAPAPAVVTAAPASKKKR
jgi:YidC/Oxa1 family membrane protein insertase